MVRFAAVMLGVFASTPAWAYWRTAVTETQDGDYNALSEHVNGDGNVDETRNAGEYNTRKEARKAANAQTKDLNDQEGVKAGDPTCDLPNVVC